MSQLTSLFGKLLEGAASFDSEAKATEQCLNLHSCFVLLSAFQAISPNLLNFLNISYSAEMSPDKCLQLEDTWLLLRHPVYKSLSTYTFADNVIGDRIA